MILFLYKHSHHVLTVYRCHQCKVEKSKHEAMKVYLLHG